VLAVNKNNKENKEQKNKRNKEFVDPVWWQTHLL